jgi:plastocyanin
MQRMIALATILVGVSMVTAWMAFAQSAENQVTAPKVIEVSAKKYEFSPTDIHVKAGTKVELKVHSVDETHGVKLSVYPEGAKAKGEPGLLFDQPGDNGKVEKGTDQVLNFVAKEPGTYDFACAKVCGLGTAR